MRRGNRSDWFSIVATDLFCGALCAVMVFDAVSRKAPFEADVPSTVTLRIRTPVGGCDATIVGFRIRSGAETAYVSSLGAGEESGDCVKRIVVADSTQLSVDKVLLIKGLDHATIDVDNPLGKGSTKCFTAEGRCR